jgi:pyrroline-5-carboxylate reductase
MKIAFLGGGNMASALIGGLLKRGFSAANLQVVECMEAHRDRLQAQYGVRTVAVVDDEVMTCDVLVLAVKPQQMREALGSFAGRLVNQTVVSIAAGLRLTDLSRWLGGHRKLVRAMPNTPALIGQGVTGLYADPAVDAAGRSAAEEIAQAVGSAVWVETEAAIDAVTAVSGSGPAYVFLFIEALEAAGIAQGLPPETARALALATFSGASALAAGSDDAPALLRERVTSKGGTTAAALAVMAESGLPEIIDRAVAAAANRGAELGEVLGRD